MNSECVQERRDLKVGAFVRLREVLDLNIESITENESTVKAIKEYVKTKRVFKVIKEDTDGEEQVLFLEGEGLEEIYFYTDEIEEVKYFKATLENLRRKKNEENSIITANVE